MTFFEFIKLVDPENEFKKFCEKNGNLELAMQKQLSSQSFDSVSKKSNYSSDDIARTMTQSSRPEESPNM